MYKLSPQQKRLANLCWQALSKLDAQPSQPVAYRTPYHTWFAVRVLGELDKSRLTSALQAMVDRYDILRTVVDYDCQAITVEPHLAIKIHERSTAPDLRDWQPETGLSDCTSRLLKKSCKGGPPWPPLRANHGTQTRLKLTLTRTGPVEHLLEVELPSLCADYETQASFLKELATEYAARERDDVAPSQASSNDSDNDLQYGDFAEWLNELLDAEDTQAGRDYWRERTANLAAIDLPRLRRSDEAGPFSPRIARARVEGAGCERFDLLCNELRATGEEIVLTCWLVLLARLTGFDHPAAGVYADGRGYDELKGALGPFARYIPISVHLDKHLAFEAAARKVSAVLDQGYKNQEYFDPDTFDWLATLFEYIEAEDPVEASGVRLEIAERYACLERFKVKLNCTRKVNSIEIKVEYDSELFEEEDARRLAEEIATMIESAAADPAQEIGRLEVMSAQEKELVLKRFNDTRKEYGEPRLVREIIDDEKCKWEDRIAIEHEGEELSYGELMSSANRLANYLGKRGVGVEEVVGICMERSVEMVIAMLGVMKAGGAYLPLDPGYPAERLEYMIKDSGVRMVVTLGEAKLRGMGLEAIDMTVEKEAIARESDRCEAGLAKAENLAYVIHTSGSTGKPKGAENTHGAIRNRLLWMQERFQLIGADRVLHKTPFSFDVSVWELLWPLMIGARMIIARPGGHAEPEYLADTIERAEVTTMHFVPAMLQAFLQAFPKEQLLSRCRSLERVICSGEELTYELRTRCLATLDAELHNLYGPTEAAVDVTHWPCARGDERNPTPIGRPISNLRMYVLDEYVEPVPLGVIGDLYIGGAGVGRGYRNRPELTSDRFIPDCFAGDGQARLYKTGDLARFLPSGDIEFMGRSDHQVKIRGQRIELGEIETVLGDNPKIRHAVVMARQDSTGNQRLVAYVVPNGDAPNERELKDAVRRALPEFMIPSAFFVLERMPLSPNGKVDRAALLKMNLRRSIEAGYAPAVTETQAELVRIWTEVLGIERIGIHDNFFELGGDSILSLQVVARANQRGLRLVSRQMFSHQSIADLASVVGEAEAIAAEQGIVRGPAPLTPIQRWFFDQEPSDPDYFNQALILEVGENINSQFMDRCVGRLLEHHDALRLRFSDGRLKKSCKGGPPWPPLRASQGIQGKASLANSGAGRDNHPYGIFQQPAKEHSEWSQTNAAIEPNRVYAHLDLAELDGSSQKSAIEAATSALQASLNLEHGPLLRAATFNLGQDKAARLFIVIHHLAVDGVSWRILLEDLQTGYNQVKEGRVPVFPSKTTSYKQWAEKLTEYAASEAARDQRSYWMLEARAQIEPLPVDFEAGENTVGTTSVVAIRLDEDETGRLLQEMPRVYKSHINEVLLTALARAYQAWSGNERLRVDLEGHGREDVLDGVDVTRTVGWFTTMYPVVIEALAGEEAEETIRRTKERLRGVPQSGFGYGLLGRDAEADLDGVQASRPVQVLFNYLGQIDQAVSGASLFRLAPESCGLPFKPNMKRTHLLEVTALVVAGCLEVSWIYGQNIHAKKNIESFAEAFKAEIGGLIAGGSGTESVYTPSDFPAADLSQQELDKLLSRLSRESGTAG